MTEFSLDDQNVYELLVHKKQPKKVRFSDTNTIIPIMDDIPIKTNNSIKIGIIIIITMIIVSGIIYYLYDKINTNNKSNYIVDNILTYDTRIIIN